jgi:hypothetical protein
MVEFAAGLDLPLGDGSQTTKRRQDHDATEGTYVLL